MENTCLDFGLHSIFDFFIENPRSSSSTFSRPIFRSKCFLLFSTSQFYFFNRSIDSALKFTLNQTLIWIINSMKKQKRLNGQKRHISWRKKNEIIQRTMVWFFILSANQMSSKIQLPAHLLSLSVCIPPIGLFSFIFLFVYWKPFIFDWTERTMLVGPFVGFKRRKKTTRFVCRVVSSTVDIHTQKHVYNKKKKQDKNIHNN